MQDTLHKLRNKLEVTKQPQIVFIGEPGVDAGGPLREFLYLITVAMAHSDMIFCGPLNSRVPRHNLVELQKQTYFFVGVIIALSLVHSGPGPQFFSLAVADYIVFGILKVKANMFDVPEQEMRGKIKKVQPYNHGILVHQINVQPCNNYTS